MPKGFSKNPELTGKKMSDTRRAKKSWAHLIGTKVGRLTILREFFTEYVPGKKSQKRFEVVCDCGKVLTVGSYRILNGTAGSCGCLRQENIIKAHRKEDREKPAFNALLSSYKNNARQRNLSWDLSEEEFRSLVKSDCWYTGRKPSSIKKVGIDSEFIFNGIDRLDSSKGYFLENCVPCCSEVNVGKMDLSLDSFLSLVKEIAIHKNLLTEQSINDEHPR